jgi:flagellar biosynthesis/type III secretory pathway protein FliH
MDEGRILKAGQGAERWPRRRISAAEWMGADRAETLVALAEAEAESVRAAAAQDRAAARAEGRRAAREEVEAGLAALAEAQRRWLARAEVEALDLAVEMARRILGQELRCDPAAVGPGALEALRAAGRRRVLRVRLHPESVAHVHQRAAADLGGLPGTSLELVADPALSPGDVVVETEAGRVDGRVASRLEGFRAALQLDAA